MDPHRFILLNYSMDCAHELLNKGKRDLLVTSLRDTVANLSKSYEMFVQLRGEGTLQCANPCFYYGKALLELI